MGAMDRKNIAFMYLFYLHFNLRARCKVAFLSDLYAWHEIASDLYTEIDFRSRSALKRKQPHRFPQNSDQ